LDNRRIDPGTTPTHSHCTGPGAPWENAYVESFNGRLRDELLNGELFTSLAEARYLVERWRVEYSTDRPHSSLNDLTPATLKSPGLVSGVMPGSHRPKNEQHLKRSLP
jgi:putative transposase